MGQGEVGPSCAHSALSCPQKWKGHGASSHALSSDQTCLPAARGRGEPGPAGWRVPTGSGRGSPHSSRRAFVPTSFLQPSHFQSSSRPRLSEGPPWFRSLKPRPELRGTNRRLLPRGGARPTRSGRRASLLLSGRAGTKIHKSQRRALGGDPRQVDRDGGGPGTRPGGQRADGRT